MNYEPLFDKPFNASRNKIKRARKHIADLERLTAEHFASNPATCTFKPHEDLAPNELIQFDMSWRGPGDDYSATFGDAIHNLRTAFDLLACDLVRARGANHKYVLFPFAASAGELDYQIQQKKFFRAGPEAVALLKQFAPHTGGNLALRAIHDLDVADKHVCMTPSGFMFDSPLMRVDQWPDGRPKLVPVGDFTAPRDMRLVFPVGYPFANEEVIPVLHKLADLTDSIVEAFEALCKLPGSGFDLTAAHASPLGRAGGGQLRLVERTNPEGVEIPPVVFVVQSASS